MGRQAPCPKRPHRVWERAPARLALLALAMSAAAFGTASVRQEDSDVQEVKVQARRYKFVPSRIEIAAGKPARIVLSSRDVEHGFRIPALSIDVRIPPKGRGSAKVELEGLEKGSYPFRCSRVCGAGHSSMRGVLIVK